MSLVWSKVSKTRWYFLAWVKTVTEMEVPYDKKASKYLMEKNWNGGMLFLSDEWF